MPENSDWISCSGCENSRSSGEKPNFDPKPQKTRNDSSYQFVNLSPTKDINGNYDLIFYTAIEDEEINEYNAGMLFSDIVLVYDNGYFNTVRFEDIIDEDQETILDEGIHNTRIEIEGYEFEIKIKTILDEISSDDFSKNLAFNNKIEIDIDSESVKLGSTLEEVLSDMKLSLYLGIYYINHHKHSNVQVTKDMVVSYDIDTEGYGFIVIKYTVDEKDYFTSKTFLVAKDGDVIHDSQVIINIADMDLSDITDYSDIIDYGVSYASYGSINRNPLLIVPMDLDFSGLKLDFEILIYDLYDFNEISNEFITVLIGEDFVYDNTSVGLQWITINAIDSNDDTYEFQLLIAVYDNNDENYAIPYLSHEFVNILGDYRFQEGYGVEGIKYDEESQKFLYAEYIDIYYWGIDEPKTFYLSETNFKNGFFAITLNVWGIDIDFTVPVGE